MGLGLHLPHAHPRRRCRAACSTTWRRRVRWWCATTPARRTWRWSTPSGIWAWRPAAAYAPGHTLARGDAGRGLVGYVVEDQAALIPVHGGRPHTQTQVRIKDLRPILFFYIIINNKIVVPSLTSSSLFPQVRWAVPRPVPRDERLPADASHHQPRFGHRRVHRVPGADLPQHRLLPGGLRRGGEGWVSMRGVVVSGC